MPFTLFTQILPLEIANIIFNYVKLQKTQRIYWEQLYSPASLILKNLINIYSNYNKVFNITCYIIDNINIINRINYRFASRKLLQKNIYIYMDEYIDNLHKLKKHLEFHFKDTIESNTFNQIQWSIIDCLDKL